MEFKHKILVVDDSKSILLFIVDVIKKSNPDCDVLQTMSPLEAIEISKAEKPALIISDWEMPGMTGIEMIREIKKIPETYDIPIIMCTGMSKAEHLKMALEAGAVDYIRKPVEPIELVARINSMLKLSESITKIKEQNQLLTEQKKEIVSEKNKSDKLLLNILPKSVAEELKKTNKASTQLIPKVSVLFADFVDFTKISEILSPQQLIERLDKFFTIFDTIISEFGLEKIKTIGDSYMCVGGLPEPYEKSAFNTVYAALELKQVVEELNKQLPDKEPEWSIRIGIHTGEVIAGVVGKKKFAYDIWGDTVNTASRIESSGEINRVNISQTTYEIIKDSFKCTHRGKIKAKNKGEIDMYFVDKLV